MDAKNKKLNEANKTLSNAQSELATLRAELAAIPEKTTGVVDYGFEEAAALKAFYDATDPENPASEPVHLYSKDDGRGTLLIKTKLEANDKGYTKVSSSLNTADEDSYLNIWSDKELSDNEIEEVKVYYKKGNSILAYSAELKKQTNKTLLRLISRMSSNIPQGNEVVSIDNSAVREAKQKEINEQMKIVEEAEGEVERIEDEIDDINTSVAAVNDYKNLSITANIKIDEPKEGETLLTLGDWGSDYTINGNGHVITYPTGANGNLTGVNKGIINNLGVVNGNIAATNGGTLKIAFETTDGKTYNIYTAEGKQEASLSMDSTLVGRARPYFGVLIDENGNFGKLDKKTAANTVYKAEWTNAESKEKTTFYTNATYEDTEVIGLSYNPAKAMANTFTYVLETENLTITEQFTEKNVVVKGICNNAKFTDNVAEGGRIYIPKKFTAKELTYDRSFKSSALATVCLPFAVSAKTLEENGVVKKMQFSYVETATNTYWFQHLGDDEAMKANEPYVLKFEDGFGGGEIFADLTNIEVAATGSSINSLAVAPSNPGNGAEFLGVFESTNASKLMRGGYTLYGFINGKFSPMDAPDPASVKMLPFRTYVRTRNENNAPAAPFILGELDEDGNIISDGDETGVNTAVKEADAFSVKGINGALVITTNKTQKVNVYTIGGSLVKATNVEAGSVTIPVAAGMYIVNGKKVFVK